MHTTRQKTAGGSFNRLRWLIRLRERLRLADDPRLGPRENLVQVEAFSPSPSGGAPAESPPTLPLGFRLTPECTEDAR
jgi:hypothetical protein